jgi:hypothetical protein
LTRLSQVFLQIFVKKSDQVREIIDQEISQSAAFRLQICLKLIKDLDDEIEALEK